MATTTVAHTRGEIVAQLDSDPLVVNHDLKPSLFEIEGEKNLFFGTGLCSARGLSHALPFDFSSYLYCS